MTSIANPHPTVLSPYGDHHIDGLTADDHYAMTAGGMVTHTYGNSMDDAGSSPADGGSPHFAHHKLLDDTEFASHFEGLSARSEETSPTLSHAEPEPSPLTSSTPRIPSPARHDSPELCKQESNVDQKSHQQSQQHSIHQHISSPHPNQLQHSESFNFEASIKIEHSPAHSEHHLQNQTPASPCDQAQQNVGDAGVAHGENHGYSTGADSHTTDLEDPSEYISRDSYSSADVAALHALPSMADMCDPNAAGSAVHSHYSHARFSPYMSNEGLPPRQPRSRAQTFAFGSHLPFNNPPNTFGLPAMYNYPTFSERTPYSGPPSPFDSLPPLATVPEHSLPSLVSTSSAPLSQQEQMFTLQPQFSHEDSRVLQMRHQFSFPDHGDHTSQQDQQQPTAQAGGRRSPLHINRQRSSSDQIMRPSPLLVDVNALHRRSSAALSYTGSLMTPIGSPHPDSPYDASHLNSPLGFPIMSTHLLPLGGGNDGSMQHHHQGSPHMNGGYGGNGTGFLNPAHLSQQPPQPRRQRAPSAPMISTSHSFFNTTSSLASPGPASAASVGTPTSGSPVFHQNTMHALPSDMHPPIMNPVDEEFKRRILQLKFEEREIAIDFLKEQAKQTGFSVLVRTSRPDYVVIICNCGRRVKQVEGERKRKRKRKTAMTGCEWHVILFRRNIPGSSAPRMWEYRASSKMEHNHPLNLNDE
ncbi:hypothetical protein BDZ88DRAFT_24481 [Geranomyces variabilis]|nr:hypothetical protein BDZ88DRAFT_24481 [Geranomyces variabilis]KAJ3133930.1 hypothetical protein HDU90_005539 [Geranomyces variabilis]